MAKSAVLSSARIKRKLLIAAIVPVFDEEKNIEYMIKFLLKNPFFDEIICVNDGSTDKSLSILKKYQNKIKIINLKRNCGKGYALAEGIKNANADITVFLDADLINLTEKHIKSLLSPILSGEKRAVLGYGTPSKNHFFSTRSFVKSITGQRAYYKKDLIPHLKQMRKTRYGVEIFLSGLFKKHEIKMVPFVKLTHIWKHKKHRPHKALRQYFLMGAEIASQLGKEKIINNEAISKFTKAADFNKAYNPFFFLGLASYYYKKLNIKKLYSYLFEE